MKIEGLLTYPAEYEEGGEIIVEGSCVRCGTKVVSTVDEAIVD